MSVSGLYDGLAAPGRPCGRGWPGAAPVRRENQRGVEVVVAPTRGEDLYRFCYPP